jgi:hypothetical protein
MKGVIQILERITQIRAFGKQKYAWSFSDGVGFQRALGVHKVPTQQEDIVLCKECILQF